MTPIRLAEPFERLRDCSDAFLRSFGARPKVYLATLGPKSKHRRRVQFIRQWLEVGGFEAVYDAKPERPTTPRRSLKRAARARLLVRDRRRLCRTGGSLRESVQGFGREGRCARGSAWRIRACRGAPQALTSSFSPAVTPSRCCRASIAASGSEMKSADVVTS